MDTDELRRILGELRFSAPLTESTLAELARSAALEQIAAGTILFNEGSRAQALYLLVAGKVALEMHVPGRGNVRILSLGAGDVLGWSALLGARQLTATAVAVDDTQAVVVPADELVSICEQDHEIGFSLMREMATALANRLVATRLQLLDLFADSSPSIVAEAEVDS